MDFMGEQLVPTLDLGQYLGLALVTAIIAGALSLEHYSVGRRGWPKRHYYAIGLLTDAGILLAWAGIERVQLNIGTAMLLLFAGCLAGVPDWILLYRRERRLAIAWRAMVRRNERMAADLAKALLLAKPRDRERICDMVEGLGFALGCMRSDLQDMKTIVGHLEPVLERFMALVDDEEGESREPPD